MDTTVRYAGLPLSHPIIAASAGTTRDADQAARCSDSGYSAVVLKSVQEEELMRYNPFPRFAVLRSGIPGFASTTFYSYEQAYYGGIDDYAETVFQSKKRSGIPVIASINCLTPEAWPAYAEACEQAGADALEIVPSCPSGMLIRDPNNDVQAIALRALQDCKAKVRIPVVPKLTQQVANVQHFALLLDEAGADGLTMINRSTGLDFDIETMAPILHGGVAGHGGAWALPAVLRWIAAVYPQAKAPISATGGATNGAEVIKCLLAGAQTVQVSAVMYLKGYDYVQTMCQEVEAYMERKHIASLADIIGEGARNIKTMAEYDRVTRYFASVESGHCTHCGRCAPVCIYDALRYEKETGAAIEKDKCDGCGLCASLCPSGAIAMHPIPR